jgi:hypothetical protein
MTTYVISVYRHQQCEFESRSGEMQSIQHYVIQLVSDLQLSSCKLHARMNKNIDVAMQDSFISGIPGLTSALPLVLFLSSRLQ